MNKKLYIGTMVQNDYQSEVDSKDASKWFKISFEKMEVIQDGIKYGNNLKDKNLFELKIREYSLERYYFNYNNELASYFNNIINTPSIAMYDDILKCINCNELYYDLDGNFKGSEVIILPCKNEHFISFDLYPLLESDCIGQYSSKFKFNYNIKKKLNKEIFNKERRLITTVLYLYIFENDGYSEIYVCENNDYEKLISNVKNDLKDKKYIIKIYNINNDSIDETED